MAQAHRKFLIRVIPQMFAQHCCPDSQSEWSLHGEGLKSFADSDREDILCICCDKDDGRKLVRCDYCRAGIVWSASRSEPGHKKSTDTSCVALIKGPLISEVQNQRLHPQKKRHSAVTAGLGNGPTLRSAARIHATTVTGGFNLRSGYNDTKGQLTREIAVKAYTRPWEHVIPADTAQQQSK